MASIFRRRPQGPWHVEYTDERGRRVRLSAKTRDKRLAQQLAARLEREAAERRAGMPAPATSAEPVDDLIAAYVADLARLGRSEKYLRSQRSVATRVASQCRWRRAADIAPAALTAFLGRLAGVSGRTVNRYRDCAVWFAGWLVKTGRLPANPLAAVARSREARVYRRRALTPDELARLVAAGGPQRGRAYALMAYSGLRRKEAFLATWADVDRSRPDWRWRLRAEITKSRTDQAVPMLPECQELLERTPEAERRDDRRLIPVTPARRSLKRDLRRAGVALADPAGRKADFHSLRYTFCTRVARVLPIQVVRVLMRHKDINLTVRVYLDLGLDDIAEGLQKLPRVFGPEDKA